jgi:hypothetical protein
MIYELRDYVATDGAAEKLNQRFAEHTVDLFRANGITVEAFWHEAGDPAKISYLLSFPDTDSQKRSWESFKSDPRWLTVRAETEADGPIVAEIRSRTLLPAPWWSATQGTRPEAH